MKPSLIPQPVPGLDMYWSQSFGLERMRAKLFRNGRSQAVRLPASCRFEGTEVDVDRDPATGIVTLRSLLPSPLDWLQQRAAQLDRDPQAAQGFAALIQPDGTTGPAQERDWP